MRNEKKRFQMRNEKKRRRGDRGGGKEEGDERASRGTRGAVFGALGARVRSVATLCRGGGSGHEVHRANGNPLADIVRGVRNKGHGLLGLVLGSTLDQKTLHEGRVG